MTWLVFTCATLLGTCCTFTHGLQLCLEAVYALLLTCYGCWLYHH